jgi:hypothetical protein
MKRLLLYSFLMTLGLCHAELPKLFCEKPFSPATLAEAVNRYVAIGEDAAIKELQQASLQESSQTEFFAGKGYSVNERIGWVCRILYEPRGHSPLRAPKFGVLALPEKTMPAENWPLYPVALSGSTYIVLKQGYTASGTPEELKHYLAYCKNNGVFRKTPVPVPTKEQAEQDVATLRQSASWKAIKWEDGRGFSFPMGEQWSWAFIQNQANGVPNELISAKKKSKADPTAVTFR